MSVWVLVLLFAFYGLCAFYVRRVQLSAYCAPLLAACTFTLFVYGFGLLGLLQTGLYLVTGLGVLLAIHTLITAPKTFLSWQTPLFLLACGLLWLRYHNAMLLQYDDFSHWGLIARYLLTNNALPDQSASLIQFQSYPPAAACWIYAVCRFAGGSEGMMITAQAWLVLMALLPLFAVAKQSTAVQSAGILVLIVIVLSIYQGTASLMVDNLLAALAIGAVTLTVRLRHASRGGAWPVAVVLATLCLVKDSGLYFALLVIALYAFLLRRNRRSIKALLPVVLLPAAGRAVWWIHIKTAFSTAAVTKHAFTLENIQSVSDGRSWEDLLSIGKAVLRSALTRYNQSLQMLALMLVCCAVIVFLRYRRTGRLAFAREGLLLAGAAVSYGLYLLLLLGMYFFTMPLAAALKAVAFERYNITFALFLYGLFAVYLLLIPPVSLPLRRLMPFMLALMLALPIALPAYRSGIRRLISETYRVPIREQIAELEEIRPLQTDETAALYIGGQSVQEDFVSYIAAYTFQQNVPIYTADTLASAALPDVLYALEADDATTALAAQGTTEIVTP